MSFTPNGQLLGIKLHSHNYTEKVASRRKNPGPSKACAY